MFLVAREKETKAVVSTVVEWICRRLMAWLREIRGEFAGSACRARSERCAVLSKKNGERTSMPVDCRTRRVLVDEI